MKNIIRHFAICLFVFICCIVNNAKACHLAAADIYIEYAGPPVDICNPVPNYTYQVTIVVYSSCGCGTNTPANSFVSYQSANEGGAVRNAPLTTIVSDVVDQLCPAFSAQNQCLTGNADYPAFRRRVYRTAPFTLPSGQTDWRFWWSSNARNPSVNINGQGNLYIEAGMNVLDRYYNNTPRFDSNPLPYICENQEYKYLNNLFDKDAWDTAGTLRIRTTIPLNAANTPLQYNPGFTADQPVAGYSLDPVTGEATFFSGGRGQYTMSFLLEDKSSYVYRDVQFAVVPCITTPPKMDSVAQRVDQASLVNVPRDNGSGISDSVVFVCPGSKLKFNVAGWSDSVDNVLFLSADMSEFSRAVNPPTFTTTGDGTDRVVSTFEWEPTADDYGRYKLLVLTRDSTCIERQKIILTTHEYIHIWVVPGINAGPDQFICEVNPQPIQLFAKGTEHLKVKWSMEDGGKVIGFKGPELETHNPRIIYPHIDGNDTVLRPQSYGYIISTVDLAGTCKVRDTVQVLLDTFNTVDIFPKNPVNEKDALVMCLPGYLHMQALPKGRPPMNNVACGLSAPSQVPTVCDEPGGKEDTLIIYGSPYYDSVYYSKPGNETPTQLYTHVQTNKQQFLVTRDELWAWGVRSSSFNGISFDLTGFVDRNNNLTQHTYNNFTISMKCTQLKELKAEDGFEQFGMVTVYTSAAEVLTDGWKRFGFQNAYNWDTTQNLLVQICYSQSAPIVCDTNNALPLFRYAPTVYKSAMAYTPTDATTLSVCDVLKPVGITVASQRPIFSLTSCEVKPLQYEYRWLTGEQLSDSTLDQALAYVSKSTSFSVEIIGRSKCKMRDTLNVYVPEHDIKITPGDTTVCLGDKAPIHITGGHYYYWHEYVNGQYVNPPHGVADPSSGYTFVGPESTTEYRIVVSDSVFCYDTISARVNVLPLPDVRILNGDDTTIRYGQPIQLLASGARFYNWSPVSSLNNPNISYPIGRPTEDTKYIVGGIGANGCRAFDTLHVIVDKRDNLFVPSAFSPNNDGKNDVFRVTNLSFQRIMEFRVFNRQGMEVFSTNDGRAGWDGTYGGVPQDIGTYSYLIRVAYPDGFVETYKGETTLIR